MIDLFFKGGLLMWPLFIVSVVSIALIIEREVFFLKNRQNTSDIEEIKDMIEVGKHNVAIKKVFGKNTIVMRFIQLVFKNQKKPKNIAEKELSLAGDKLLFDANRYIHVQELIGSISPLIGLSGTILGLLEAFKEIGINSPDASLLAGGIWSAMITTVAGLFIAIPSLIFAHLNRHRVNKLAFAMKIYGEEINTILREYNKKQEIKEE